MDNNLFDNVQDYIDHKYFLCVKDFYMENGKIAFKKGNVYTILGITSIYTFVFKSDVSDLHTMSKKLIDKIFVPFYTNIGDHEVWEDETNEEYDYEKNKFEINDVVLVNGFVDDIYFNNVKGVLCYFSNNNYYRYGIDFENSFENEYLHDLFGNLDKNTGYFVGIENLQLIELEDIEDYEVWENIQEKLDEGTKELEEGDIIQIIDTIGRDKYGILGKKGTVKYVNKNWYGIEFLEPIINYTGMNVPGCKEKHGVWIHKSNNYIVIKNLSIGDYEVWEDEINEEYNFQKNIFKEGDTVMVSGTDGDIHFRKEIGKVIYYDNEYIFVVQFNRSIREISNGEFISQGDGSLNYGKRGYVWDFTTTNPHLIVEPYKNIGDYEIWEDETNEEYNYKENKFEIGDRVIINGDFVLDDYFDDETIFIGKKGAIIKKNIDYRNFVTYLILLDEPIYLHDNDYYDDAITEISVTEDEIDIIENKNIGDYEVWEDETNEEYDYKKKEFEIGDTVKILNIYGYDDPILRNLIGEIGIIIDVYNVWYCVEPSNYVDKEKLINKVKNVYDGGKYNPYIRDIIKRNMPNYFYYFFHNNQLELIKPGEIGDYEVWEDDILENIKENFQSYNYPIVIGIGYNNDINIHNRLGFLKNERELTYGIEFFEKFSNRQRKINDNYNENGLWVKKENVIIIDNNYYEKFLKNTHKIKINKKIKDILPMSNIMVDYGINEIDYSVDRDDVVLVNGREYRLGRLYNKIFDFLTDREIERLVNYYKYKYNNNIKKEIKLKIVDGENIRYWYNCEHYSEGNGTLNNSCMRYPQYASKLDLFVDNPSKIKMIILLDSEEKLLGRAIIWYVDVPEYITYMDRIYTTEDKYKDYFINYANKHHMLMYDSFEFFNNEENIIELYGTPKMLQMNDIKNYENNHPSMDTFKCYYPEEKSLKNYITKDKKIDFYIEM